jgi:hypothetical protein
MEKEVVPAGPEPAFDVATTEKMYRFPAERFETRQYIFLPVATQERLPGFAVTL